MSDTAGAGDEAATSQLIQRAVLVSASHHTLALVAIAVPQIEQVAGYRRRSRRLATFFWYRRPADLTEGIVRADGVIRKRVSAMPGDDLTDPERPPGW